MIAPLVSIAPSLRTAMRRPTRERNATLIALLIVAAAVACRVPGMFTDFWLDEIWSYNVAGQLQSLSDLLFSDAARIDNNHPLNTLLMRAIGSHAPYEMYRLPSLLAGIGCVWVVARRDARAALLVAVSFPFAFYSSEARGYMPAVFCAIVGFEALRRNRERFSCASAATFVIACVLGFLSHLTFVHFYLAAMGWSVFFIRTRERSAARQLAQWLALHAMPIVFIVIVNHVFVKHLVIGGAPPRSTADVLLSAWSMLLGGPELTATSGWVIRAFGYAFAALAIGGFVAATVESARRRDDRWLFDVLIVVVAPSFLLAYDLILSARPQPLMVRYFLVAMIFALLAIARGIAALPRGYRNAAVVIVMLASVVELVAFANVGRGGYERAMDRVITASGAAPAAVNGDSDFRVGEIVRFYDARRPPLRHLRYATDPADWLILSSPDSIPPRSFRFDSIYPTSSLSGTTWRLYRRAPMPPPPTGVDSSRPALYQ